MIVALISMIKVIASGFQAALMVPTEVLAKQHYETIKVFLKEINIKPVLILGQGRIKKHELEEIKNNVENGFSKLKNVVIISSENNISSYELIKISDLVLVYNSTVALESVLLNKNVLTAGNAHYTRINYFKPSKNKDKYFESFKKLLNQKHEIPNNIYSDVEQYFYSLVQTKCTGIYFLPRTRKQIF